MTPEQIAAGPRELLEATRVIDALLSALDAERAAHAQFRQEVSDAVEEVTQRQGKLQALLRFIIPKPDPLVEVQSLLDDGLTLEEAVGNLGLKLVEVGDAD